MQWVHTGLIPFYSSESAVVAKGHLLGFALAARQPARGSDPLRLAAYGALCGLPAFSAVIFSAPLGTGALFRAGAMLIGFGGGLFAVGTLTAAMRMEERGMVGLALGAWGAVQATASGLSIAAGGFLRDAVGGLAQTGALGAALAAPATGYSVVYHIEMLLLFVTLIAIGPLVGRGLMAPSSERKFGLAELPG